MQSKGIADEGGGNNMNGEREDDFSMTNGGGGGVDKNKYNDDIMTLEEQAKIAYLLRYENMVKHQEAEDMAVREHLLPIFDKLTNGESWLTFADMHHWFEVLQRSSPSEECIMTDSQLMMILETFGDESSDESWSFTDFAFCYKFIILGMQTLQHLSLQEENVRQTFKDIFFKMLQEYHNHHQPPQDEDDREAPEMTQEEDDEETKTNMRKLLTLKDRQMAKLISHMQQEHDDHPPDTPKSLTSKDTTFDNDDNDDQSSAVQIHPIHRKRNRHFPNHNNAPDYKHTTNDVSKRRVPTILNFCLVGIIVMASYFYIIDKNNTLHNHHHSSPLVLTNQSPPTTKQMMALPIPTVDKEEEVFTSKDFNELKKSLTRSIEQSQNELYEARSQIQSLVSVLAEVQNSKSTESTKNSHHIPNNMIVTETKKPSLVKKLTPIVLSTLGGALIMYSIQPLLLPTSAKLLTRGGASAISSSKSIHFLGKVKMVWSRFCQLASRIFLIMFQPQTNFNSIIV